MRYSNKTIKNAVDLKYRHYTKCFLNKNCYLDGIQIFPKKYPMFDNKCGTFFHMITKEKEEVPCRSNSCRKNECTYHFDYNPLIKLKEEPRHICPFRLMHLNLDDFFNKPLLIWEKCVTTKKGKRIRILCYDKDSKYLLILDKNKNNGNVMLWTGYPIVYNWKHKKLITEYNQYASNKKEKHHTSSN